MKLKHIVVIFCIFIGALQAANKDVNEDEFYQRYYFPEWHLLRMNYCTIDGKMCGHELANAFCRNKGYHHAESERIAWDTGVTNFFGTNLQCKGCCNGFSYINCAGRITHEPPELWRYRYRRFNAPMLDNIAVDYCYKRGNGCGKKAANAFCRIAGYKRADAFARSACLPHTKTAGSNQQCFGPDCRGFAYITCYR